MVTAYSADGTCDMADDPLDRTIRQVFAQTYAELAAGRSPPPLSEATVLLDTGLDSLGFAIVVTRLEMALGYDPFTLAPEPFYPRTYGEFLAFYRDNRPA